MLSFLLSISKMFAFNKSRVVLLPRIELSESYLQSIWFRSGSNLAKAKNSYRGIDTYSMNLKQVGLELCTCTWIEIMTCVGVTLYLLYLSQFSLALITVAIFSPLIGFHFAISKLTQSDNLCVSCQGVRALRVFNLPKSIN